VSAICESMDCARVKVADLYPLCAFCLTVEMLDVNAHKINHGVACKVLRGVVVIIVCSGVGCPSARSGEAEAGS
jgi:hypothetical protein